MDVNAIHGIFIENFKKSTFGRWRFFLQKCKFWQKFQENSILNRAFEDPSVE